MKKTWKHLIAIACALSMIACLLPAAALAENEVATPTDLAPVEEPAQVVEPAEEPAAEQDEEKVTYIARIAAIQKEGKIFLTAVVEPELVGKVIWEMKRYGTDGEEKWNKIENDSPTLLIVPGSELIGKEIRFRLEDGTTCLINYVVPELEEVSEEPADEQPAEEPADEQPVEETEEEPADEQPVEETEEEPADEQPVEETEEEPAEEPVEEIETEVQNEPDAEQPVEEPDVEATAENSVEGTAEESGEEPAGEVIESEIPAEEPTDEEPAEELDVEVEIVEEEIEEYQMPLGLTDIPEEEEAPFDRYAREEEESDTEVEIIEETDPEIVKTEEEPLEEAVVIYVYERDENGELVLDENGNPIVTVIGDGEIPVTYQRDENGELVLDENGDPIPTQTLPTDAVIIDRLEDALNPDRNIEIYYSWNNMEPALGVEVTFIAVLYGYDNLEYTVQWQQSKNGSDWTDVPGSIELRHSETITRENYKDLWRVQVMITGIEE